MFTHVHTCTNTHQHTHTHAYTHVSWAVGVSEPEVPETQEPQNHGSVFGTFDPIHMHPAVPNNNHFKTLYMYVHTQGVLLVYLMLISLLVYGFLETYGFFSDGKMFSIVLKDTRVVSRVEMFSFALCRNLSVVLHVHCVPSSKISSLRSVH